MLVTGCAINIDADFYADIDSRIRCEKNKALVCARAMELVDTAADIPVIPDALVAMRNREKDSFRTRVDLKIQDGCDNACSYCIVHSARGPARSMPAEQVVEQARLLSEHGTKELVLVGIDLAAYRDGNTDLAGLIRRIESETAVSRIRISSVEPQSITPSLIELLATSNGRVCRHLHLCLQSGSTKVLQEMNRNYTAKSFLALVAQLKSAVPSIALSTDAIVGFPGETDEDFEQTCAVIEQAQFMRLHVFRYSKRPGTPAARRYDQIDPRVKAERSEKLRELGWRLALEDMKRRLGTREQVIVERQGMGTSESYHTVACPPHLSSGEEAYLEFARVDETRMQLIGSPVIETQG